MNKIVLTLASNFYDLTKSVISKVKEKSDWENIIVVPDRFSLLAELEVFHQNNLESVFHTNVMPISRLAYSLLEKIDINLKSVSKEEESFLVRRAIQKTKKDFVCFSKNLSPSMCDEIAKTISQLKSCKIFPEQLTGQDLKPSLQDKLSDLKAIYTEYEVLLESQVDSGKLLEIFDENIEKIQSLKNTNLFFLGFDSFTTQIFEVIKSLSKVCQLMVVGGFYHFAKENKRVYETDIFDKFKFFKKNPNFEIEYIQNTLNSNQIAVLENVFSNRINKTENTDFYTAYTAESNQQQITFVLNQILKNIKKNNMQFGDFAIACADLETSKNELEKYFKKYKINYYIDSSENMAKTSFAQFIFSFYQLLLNHFDKVDLIDFINTLFVFEDHTQRANTIYLIQKYALVKQNFLDQKVRVFSEDKEHEKALKDLTNKLVTLYQTSKKCETVLDYINLTKQVIAEFSCKTIIEKQAQNNLEKKDLKQQKIYLQLFDKVNQSLQSLEKYLSQETVTVKEFYDLLKNSFENKTISTVPISGDCVFVGDATNSFFGQVKHLYVLDATYDALPKTIFDSGIINDDNIKEMDEVLKISPTIKAINKRNKFKILNLLTCATEKLTTIHTLLNADSKENLPASFVVDLYQAFNTKIMPCVKQVMTVEDYTAEYQNNLAAEFYSPEYAKEFLYQNLNSEKEYKQEFINSVYQVLLNHGFIKEEEINQLQQKPMPKLSNAKELFFSKNKTSISQLETYFRSPFKHFLTYGLRLQEQQTSDIEKLDIGNYLHYIAEKFVDQIKNNLAEIGSKDIETIVKQITSKAKEEKQFYKFGLTKENKSMLAYLNFEARSMCRAILSHTQKSNFVPSHTEKEFLIENYFEKQHLNLSGKADRIDEFEQFFTIIDYKTGTVEFNSTLVYTGQKLQLLIYADIYEKQTGKSVAGVFYFPVKNSFEEAKDYKLKGTFKRDGYVLMNLDKTISYDNPTSDFISAKINKNQESISSGIVEIDKRYGTDYLHEMIAYAKEICKQAIDEILQGNIPMIEDKNSDLDLFENDNYQKIKLQKFSKLEDEIFKKVTKNTNE